jgi:hypothetical protein
MRTWSLSTAQGRLPRTASQDQNQDLALLRPSPRLSPRARLRRGHASEQLFLTLPRRRRSSPISRIRPDLRLI